MGWNSEYLLTQRLYTGGEDGCILQWNMDETAAVFPAGPPVELPSSMNAQGTHSTSNNGAQRHKGRRGTVKHRFAPYK